MRKIILLCLSFSFLLISCSNYVKKVKINDNLEVYLKGDNVSETDAKKLGNYITTLMTDSRNDKSFQLSKDSGTYVVKMVVDEDKLKADSTIDVSFIALKSLIELEVFKNSKVKLVITDNQFKDIRSF
jgi:hypothetical protein